MSDEHSLIGIGLPVYNNGKFLSKTLDCLLEQTYENIVIYISDDCSTDDTQSICEKYAASDERIVYSRNANNVGANANHIKVLEMASTDYFMYSRGHELMSDNLIEECLKSLLGNPSAVLSFCTTYWIDENGDVIADKPIGYSDTMGFDVVSRCAAALWGNWDSFYGLSKTDILRSIRTNEELVGNDTLTVFEKALIGGFAHARLGVRYRRYHHYFGETYKQRINRLKTTTYKNLGFIDRLFPLLRLPLLLFTSVKRSNINWKEKLMIIWVILFNAPIRYFVARGKRSK